jgi:membrane protein DedA with SNARE-associated domain
VDLAQAINQLEPWIHDYGVVAVTVVLTFESFGAPLPGESLLIVASVLAGRGAISFTWLLFFSWLGAVLGDKIGYIIGRVLGRSVILRHGKRIGLDANRLKKI